MKNPLEKKGIYLYQSFKEKILSEYTGKGKVLKMTKDIFQRPMYDTEIQKEICNSPMSVNDFITTCPTLIKEKSLLNNGCANIFYIQTKQGVVAVFVRWDGEGWVFNCRELGGHGLWYGDYCVFSADTKIPK